MGLLFPSPTMLAFALVICFNTMLPYILIKAGQSSIASPATTTTTTTTSSSARTLDMLLQDYAYRAFGLRPKTGIPYNGAVPSNLTGIRISAMRLRSGSLRRRGVEMYNEFQIPTGLIVSPYVERLVLVYHNLGNWSALYYPLPGYTYLAPMLGLLAYSASNLSAPNLPELDINVSGDPVLIKFDDVIAAPGAKCVWFGLNGSVNFNNVAAGNVCSTVQPGHFSIVVESLIAPSPAPIFPAPVLPGGSKQEKKNINEKSLWVILGSVLGGLLLLVILLFLIFWLHNHKRKKKIGHMERTAEAWEALRMTAVGDGATRAPTAMMTRTKPTLEREYTP